MPRTAEEIAKLPYRKNVGVMLINHKDQVFVGRRIDMKGPHWQMPQGGIDPGETPEEAALRELLDRSLVAGFVTVSGDESIAAARELAEREGIFAGFSSGANLAAAKQLLRDKEPGSRVAILACDSGLKYLSTGLWPPA